MHPAAFLLALCLPALVVGDCDSNFKKGATPLECCDVKLFPKNFKDHRRTCLEKSPEFEKDRTCADECMLETDGLLDEHKGLDKAKVKEVMQFKEDEKGATEVNRALEECLNRNPGGGQAATDAKTCKSGAADVITCLMREVFLNCPTTQWKKDSNDCEELKNKVKGCPQLQVIL